MAAGRYNVAAGFVAAIYIDLRTAPQNYIIFIPSARQKLDFVEIGHEICRKLNNFQIV